MTERLQGTFLRDISPAHQAAIDEAVQIAEKSPDAKRGSFGNRETST